MIKMDWLCSNKSNPEISVLNRKVIFTSILVVGQQGSLLTGFLGSQVKAYPLDVVAGTYMIASMTEKNVKIAYWLLPALYVCHICSQSLSQEITWSCWTGKGSPTMPCKVGSPGVLVRDSPMTPKFTSTQLLLLTLALLFS